VKAAILSERSDATQSFSLTVQSYSASLSITSANSATVVTGAAGSFTVTARGSPTPTLSESGTLPSGITFSAGTGVLRPTHPEGQRARLKLASSQAILIRGFGVEWVLRFLIQSRKIMPCAGAVDHANKELMR